jgi:ankyrin repeat protein
MNDVNVVEFLLDQPKQNNQQFMDAKSGIHGSALRAALSAALPAKDTALHLIEKGADIISGDGGVWQHTASAAFVDLFGIVRTLLDMGKLDVNVLDKNNQIALHIAAYRDYGEVVKTLLSNNADANLKDV